MKKFKDLSSRKSTPVKSCHDSHTGQLAPSQYAGEDSYKNTVGTRPYGGVDYKKSGPKHD